MLLFARHAAAALLLLAWPGLVLGACAPCWPACAGRATFDVTRLAVCALDGGGGDACRCWDPLVGKHSATAATIVGDLLV